MKNILLITTIYPLKSNNKGTPVCHYFAKEWVRMGYNVKVIHIQNIYPFYFYWIAKLFTKFISSKTGAVVYTKRDKGDKFILDDVEVSRIPVLKFVPHGKCYGKSIKKVISEVKYINERDNFVPNLIVGHFPNPQIELVNILKNIYPSAISSIVMHGDIWAIKSSYKKNYRELLKNIDIWGFRSEAIKKQFELEFGKVNKSFMCYSGIPENIIVSENKKDFSGQMTNFIYIGEMIKRKFPMIVLHALHELYTNDFKLTYIGDGYELNEIKDKIVQFNLSNSVQILGKLKRMDIINYLDNSDCFIMISKGEAFGLVYLEAMARGCITIGSRNEGIDGVIIDGYNGFLCEAGNVKELEDIITKINRLPSEERKKISDNAVETARNMTDYKVAEHYINSIINC